MIEEPFDIKDDLFQEKIYRDLLAVIYSPLVVRDFEAELLQREMVETVDKFISKHRGRLPRIITWPEPRLPLGKWFERVFFAALKITYPFAEVFHSLSDQNGGELDFVVMNGRDILHIECAVKFFLHIPTLGSGLESFVGPGGRDRLDLKFAKMRDVQLKRMIPVSVGSADSVKRVLWMGGRIHWPLPDEKTSKLSLDPAINPNHDRGYWGRLDDVAESLVPGECLLRLPKLWWMTPLDGLRREFINYFEAQDLRERLTEPVMTARVRVDDDHLREVSRGFVTPS